jgi:hypothetical protein
LISISSSVSVKCAALTASSPFNATITVSTLSGSVHIDCHAPAVAAGTLGFRDYDNGGVHIVTYADDLGSIWESYQFVMLQAVQMLINYRLNWSTVEQFGAKHCLLTLRDLQAPVLALQEELGQLMKDIAEGVPPEAA